jgi:hypothetical protein
MEMKKGMMVYVVCGGMDYDGEDVEYSVSVFMNKEDAKNYGESLKDGSFVDCDGDLREYDYYKIKEVELG